MEETPQRTTPALVARPFTYRAIGPFGRFAGTLFMGFLAILLAYNITMQLKGFGRPSFGVLLEIALDVLVLICIPMLWGCARLRFKPISRAVVWEQTRWPRRSVRRSIPLDEITGAEVRGKTARGGHVYWVVLMLGSSESIRLSLGGSSARGYHENQAHELRAVLASWRAIDLQA